MSVAGLRDLDTKQIETTTTVVGSGLVPYFVDKDSLPQLTSVTNLATDAFEATPAEINSMCDASTRVEASVDPTTLALTAALHANKIVYLTDLDGAALTLPAALGTGDIYEILIAATITSSSTTIKAASASDSFLGACFGVDDDADAAYAWKAETADDTVTYDGSATGGKAGDWMKFTDIATGLWKVEGQITQSGASEATPFSATVS